MSKSGSRYGRRSNWFKIHCLLQEQQQQGLNIGNGMLRNHPYMPLFRNPPPITTDTKSSESDSGASSADLEDDIRSTSGLSCFRFSTSPAVSEKSTVSSKKLPSPISDGEYFSRKRIASPMSLTLPVSPNGPFSKWLPTFHGIGDPNAFRELWLRGSLPLPEPVPEQDQPIDLSIRNVTTQVQVQSDSEIIKPVPLDLSLERQTDVVTN